MKSKDDGLKWLPLWVDKWIFGSTRIELQHDERAIWVDLMALAAKDNGYVRANPETPYAIVQLAGLLCATEELLHRAIQRCIETGKIVDQNGIYYLINWQEFKLSERQRRRIEKHACDSVVSAETATMSAEMATMSAETATVSESVALNKEKSRVEKSIGEKKPFDKSKGPRSHPKTVLEFIEEIKKSPAYSHLDIDEQIEKIRIWLLKPENKGKQLTSARILNWLNKEPKPLEVSDGKPPTDVVKRRLWDLEQDERRRSESAQKDS